MNRALSFTSERIDKEEREGVLPSTLGKGVIVKRPLRNSHRQVESLWVRIKDCTNKGQLVVGVYYRPPDHGEPVDEAFLLQLQEVSHSHTLILMRDLNHSDVCWQNNTAG